MSAILTRWNFLAIAEAVSEILPCCGSHAWANGMVARRPLLDEARLLAASDEIWDDLAESDQVQAFRSHPRIAESRICNARELNVGLPRSAAWSEQEQQQVAEASDAMKTALVEGNREYEQKFKRIFIVCATGKSAAELLNNLQRRMQNDDDTEFQEAAEQQRQITEIRLRKWLQGQGLR